MGPNLRTGAAHEAGVDGLVLGIGNIDVKTKNEKGVEAKTQNLLVGVEARTNPIGNGVGVEIGIGLIAEVGVGSVLTDVRDLDPENVQPSEGHPRRLFQGSELGPVQDFQPASLLPKRNLPRSPI